MRRLRIWRQTFAALPRLDRAGAWRSQGDHRRSGMRMVLVYLVRHGEADYRPVRHRGWPGSAADLAPLSSLGVEQARGAADGLAGAGATAVVASPMTRALQTAAIVAVRLGLPVSVQFDLREWLPDDTFSWRSAEDVQAAVDDFDAHGGEWPDGRPRAWEPLSQLRERCTAALRTAIEGLPGHEVIIVVCHGMVIWSLTGNRQTRPGQWRNILVPPEPAKVALLGHARLYEPDSAGAD